MTEVREDVHDMIEVLRSEGNTLAAHILQNVAGLLWAREAECRMLRSQLERYEISSRTDSKESDRPSPPRSERSDAGPRDRA